MTVRTRFAPSPTGFLHIGGVRTALFNYLYARHHGGEFVLRIEDTDRARSTEESIQAIMDGMEWLGLDYDGEPIYQSKRFDIYKEHAEKLIENGLAYRCWCTPQELQQRREDALKAGRAPRYDKRCKPGNISAEQLSENEQKPFAVRFKVPEGGTTFKDLIKGSISIEHDEIEDLVILRSDGTTTYNLCVVVDDATQGITHIIRGDDHINNTPKQILLYKALGYPIPEFAHLPMILGSDKGRLSKRHGATSVTAYRDMGYLPEAIINYLARLGWSCGDQEIFTMAELVEKFTLESVGKSAGVFNPEKLIWLNHHYIKEASIEDLQPLFLTHLKELGPDAAADPRVPAIMETVQEKAQTMVMMAEDALFYFTDEVTFDEKAKKKFLTAEKLAPFTMLTERLTALDEFTLEAVETAFNSVLDECELKLGKLAQPVRVALTGTKVSPGIFETITAMGKEKTLKRLNSAIAILKKASETEET
ncbi:Glutamyl-tRNA synthetase [hydrothermal vent metagenome]|uniref:glutamate--tRNA ligase n=1 Tax=hydrothermal vent metagenome TaxID=652676 RepID=A0A3B0QU38_9ZZZZ